MGILKDLFSGRLFVKNRIAEAKKKKKETGKDFKECLQDSLDEAAKKRATE